MDLSTSKGAFVHPRATLILLLALAYLTLPLMAGVGMFFDGTIYASISRNLSIGVGSFWDPHFSKTLFPNFREHPPLMFFLQSLFFNALGESFLTERIYDVTLLLLSVGITWKIWRILLLQEGRSDLSPYFWLVLLGLMTITKWLWGYRNNVLENTLTLFCLAAVLAFLNALFTESNRQRAFYAAISSIFVFAAFLTKGVTSFFVLILPLLVFLIYRIRILRVLQVYLYLSIFTASFIFLVFFTSPEPLSYMQEYFNRQLNERVGFDNLQWGLIFELAKSIIPMALISSLTLYALGRKKGVVNLSIPYRPILLLLIVGGGASLPLMLGDLPSGHYLLPSFPYYGMAFGIFMAAALSTAEKVNSIALDARPGGRFLVVYSAFLLILPFIILHQYGEVRRDHTYHRFLAAVCETISPCEGKVISTSASIWKDWKMHAIAQRHFRLAIDNENPTLKYSLEHRDESQDSRYIIYLEHAVPWVLLRNAD